jgi:ABC-type branched-subunit amino acid transport system substrate-binding protein
MMRRTSVRAGALLAAGALLVAACSSSGSNKTGAATTVGGATTTAAPGTTTGGSTTTAAASTSSPASSTPAATTWAVNTKDCVDPAAADKAITGTLHLGSVMPLSGGIAAAAFAPVKAGFEAYIDYANKQKMLGDVKIDVNIQDDQYNKDKTPGAVSKLIDGGVDVVAGIIGTPDNLAVRQTLNDSCIPQLNALTGSPHWGEVKDFPWTMGILVPYDIESKIYAKQLSVLYPKGAKVALFYINTEFGTAYADAFKELAKQYNLDIVDTETIEGEDATPPKSQVTNIAAKKPDVVMAVPLGAGCVTFLNALAAAKAQNAGWNPATFITNTCASSLILGAAGPDANGIYTSGATIDIGNPANATLPKVKQYLDIMKAAGHADIATTAAAGWATAEATVAMLQQAQKSSAGLTRASIIDAARNFTFTPMLARPGVVLRSNGETDPFLAQSLQVIQYDAAKKIFTDVGKLITEFETK